jgi:CubicO group peptidase (beta-lactamase class C family)
MMDMEAKKPVKQNTIFRFYSMTKPVTSVAAMMLYEEGKLKLDDPVSKYIPEFKGLKVYAKTGKHTEQEREMSIRDLFRHTSGLTYGFFGNTPVDKMYRARSVFDWNSSLQDMIDKLSEIPLLHQPSTKWHYSVSTDVLGYIVEKVSGQSLDKFFKTRIFKPLKMKDTAFHVPAKKVERFAVCYGPNLSGGLRIVDDPNKSRYLKKPSILSGGGGLVSTARDYLRFCQMLLNKGQLDGKRLLRPETVEMMTKNQLPDSVKRGKDGGFGLGFSVRLKDGKFPKGEYGWGGAASTHFWISPKHDLIVIALSQYMPFSGRLENTIKPLVYDSILN